MKYRNDEIIFHSGNYQEAYLGIVGLGPDLSIYQGYTGVIQDNKIDELFDIERIEDLIELSDAMAERWKELRENLEQQLANSKNQQ